MSDSFDIIIVGSGPAGVSAAFPLVQAGLKVLMVDGGHEANLTPPSSPFLTERFGNEDQWRWMVGEDFYALKQMNAVSPKLRAATHQYVFNDFIAKNNIESENFIAIGSLAKGGLSNAWGCGVACLSEQELADYPFPVIDIMQSYETVTRRIGVSGAHDDDLSGYFGVDSWSQPPIPMDELHQRIFARYLSSKPKLVSLGFRLGRSRVAVLSKGIGERRACDITGNCLWGCHQNAMYTSVDELPSLLQHNNFYYQSGFVVDQINKNRESVAIEGQYERERKTITAKKILLAAGTLATTKLALHALNFEPTVRLQSCPTAAFLLWIPKMLGTPRKNSFGLGQLSFSLNVSDGISAFGSTFSTVGIPVSEFVRHMPLCKRYSIDLLHSLLGSCLVGNMFLPGHLSTTEVSVNTSGELKISGGYSNAVSGLMSDAEARLQKSFWKVGTLLLPKSFTQGLPGGDIHYSSTLPMCNNPKIGQTNSNGELAGLEGVYIVDGACLSTLTEKSHTLTIMANADRIGRILAIQMTGKSFI